MLQKLSVENYALIDKLEMELSESLNIITGETGAGKSILLGALGLLQGNRADASVIKDAQRSCVVEGAFEIGAYDLQEFFTENDLDYEPHTIVRRTINSAGKSRAYINDLPVQLAILREFVSRLVDIHSQHQTLMIADEAFRLRIVDSVAANSELRGVYSQNYRNLRAFEKELVQLREQKATAERDREWLTHQAQELAAAKLKAGEQAELEAELNELVNADAIRGALGGGSELLGADETGVLVTLKGIAHELERIKDIYPVAGELAIRVNSTYLELKDVEGELSESAGHMEFNQERIDKVESRLNMIYGLEQKHRAENEAQLIALFEEYERKLEAITSGDEAIGALEQKVAKLTSTAKGQAEKISSSRKAAAIKIKRYAEAMLSELGIPHAVIEIAVDDSGQLRQSGQDDVRIMFSANKNMALQPIEKSASGGELSRVMLAIKSMVAQSSQLPTIIFDEIDTGVSGQIADKMGSIIHALSTNMQVVNITHLPQVASKGDTHWLVYKDDSSTTTSTHVVQLSAEDRVQEIAKMLSGSAITQAAIDQATLLLSK